MAGPSGKGDADRLRSTEVSPVVLLGLLGVGAIALLALLYFAWLRPKMIADAALRDFNTPEAQARRDPDLRTPNPATRDLVKELLAKEKMNRAGHSHRARRDE